MCRVERLARGKFHFVFFDMLCVTFCQGVEGSKVRCCCYLGEEATRTRSLQG